MGSRLGSDPPRPRKDAGRNPRPDQGHRVRPRQRFRQHPRLRQLSRRRVPIGDYDSFSPYIDRMRAGESNLLVPEFVRYFGNSSGARTTVGKVPADHRRQIRLQRRAGADTLMRYLRWSNDDQIPLRLHPRPLSAHTMRSEGPVLVTSNPAMMMSQMPSHPARVPARERRAHDRQLRREASGHRRAIHRPRRARPGGNDVLVHASLRKVLAAARALGRPATTVSEVGAATLRPKAPADSATPRTRSSPADRVRAPRPGTFSKRA